jgi:hypothetical protein
MTIIQPTNFKTLTDQIGLAVTTFQPGIDVTNLICAMLSGQLSTIFGTTDPDQFGEWLPYSQGLTKASGASTINAAGQSVSGAFTGFGVGGGSFGAGSGFLSRNAEYANFISWINGSKRIISSHASQDGISGVVDLNSYATYFNTITPYQMLYTPAFAAAYWYANNGGQQLLPANVFAPAEMQLATFTYTGVNAGTLSNNASTNWPTTNGYSSPAPVNTGGQGTSWRSTWSSITAYVTKDVVVYNNVYYVAVAGSTNITPGTDITKWVINTFGNNLYLGGMPVAQAFAPINVPACRITVTINGTGVVTVTGVNQAGTAGRTWTATISSATAGTLINLVPTVPGDRLNGVPTAIAAAGTATAGAFNVVTTAER